MAGPPRKIEPVPKRVCDAIRALHQCRDKHKIWPFRERDAAGHCPKMCKSQDLPSADGFCSRFGAIFAGSANRMCFLLFTLDAKKNGKALGVNSSAWAGAERYAFHKLSTASLPWKNAVTALAFLA